MPPWAETSVLQISPRCAVLEDTQPGGPDAAGPSHRCWWEHVEAVLLPRKPRALGLRVFRVSSCVCLPPGETSCSRLPGTEGFPGTQDLHEETWEVSGKLGQVGRLSVPRQLLEKGKVKDLQILVGTAWLFLWDVAPFTWVKG